MPTRKVHLHFQGHGQWAYGAPACVSVWTNQSLAGGERSTRDVTRVGVATERRRDRLSSFDVEQPLTKTWLGRERLTTQVWSVSNVHLSKYCSGHESVIVSCFFFADEVSHQQEHIASSLSSTQADFVTFRVSSDESFMFSFEWIEFYLRMLHIFSKKSRVCWTAWTSMATLEVRT